MKHGKVYSAVMHTFSVLEAREIHAAEGMSAVCQVAKSAVVRPVAGGVVVELEMVECHNTVQQQHCCGEGVAPPAVGGAEEASVAVAHFVVHIVQPEAQHGQHSPSHH